MGNQHTHMLLGTLANFSAACIDAAGSSLKRLSTHIHSRLLENRPGNAGDSRMTISTQAVLSSAPFCHSFMINCSTHIQSRLLENRPGNAGDSRMTVSTQAVL